MNVSRAKSKLADVFIGSVTPHDIALGFTLGTIVALLPTFGFSILLTAFLVFLFPHINKPAAFLALAFWNPLLQIPIYTLSFQIGTMLFGDLPIVHYDVEILNQIYTFTRRFLIGNLATTSFFAISSYAIMYVTSRFYLSRS